MALRFIRCVCGKLHTIAHGYGCVCTCGRKITV